jgi:hypothetical protein
VTRDSLHKISALSLPRPRYLLWGVLVVLASLNAVLRPSPLIPITPYYLLMPIVCFFIAMRANWARRWILSYSFFAIYGLLVGYLFGVPILMQSAQLLKYAQLLTFFLMLTWLYRMDSSSRPDLHKIVRILTGLVFLIATIQVFTGLEFPTVVNEESGLWLNTYFYTPNDLALFLCGVFCLVLCGNASMLTKVAFFVAFIALNLRNDAKAAILASFLMIGMFAFVRVCFWLRLRPFVGLMILLSLITIIVANASDNAIEFGESEFNVFQLFQDPFVRIINLEPYNLGGSIFDRTDALIYSIEAMKSMSWFGLGPGGSVYNLSLPDHELLTAKSLHNAIAEIYFEFGLASLLVFYLLLKPFMRALLTKRPTSQQICLMCLVAASPLLSVSQSSGYISNYAFWLTAFLIWYPVSIAHRDSRQALSMGHPLSGFSNPVCPVKS